MAKFRVLCLVLLWRIVSSNAALDTTSCEDDTCQSPPRVPQNCTLVYAPLQKNNGRWGVVSLIDRERGSPVWKYFGDVVHQLVDSSSEHNNPLHEFVWNGQETGGQDEGIKTVHSVVPGLGMMTRTSETPNLLPLAPRIDEGGLTRFESPGAGAITHYHNYTWYVSKSVQAGQELTMSRALRVTEQTDEEGISKDKMATLEELRATGYCLDNVRPRKSRLKEAGRGVVATRSFQAGEIVAPVPVVAIPAASLGDSNTNKQLQQLLTNYCLGNANSTIRLYPYGPFVNLVNHFPEPNVALRWSTHTQSEAVLKGPLSLSTSPFLLMELVATRPIPFGQELFLDYSRRWDEAWYQHVQAWTPADRHYTPSYVMDDAIQLLRTQQEQKVNPYDDNVFTSCFYRYSDREENEKSLQQPESSDSVTSFRWKFQKGLFDLKNLRPCQVVKRNEGDKGRSAYAVRILNRPGLEPEEQIPPGELHIVTHIPRSAIRFSDKAGSTDAHLKTAFRQEIWLTDDVFPEAWRDLEADSVGKERHSVDESVA